MFGEERKVLDKHLRGFYDAYERIYYPDCRIIYYFAELIEREDLMNGEITSNILVAEDLNDYICDAEIITPYLLSSDYCRKEHAALTLVIAPDVV
jgi:hypothetical protein